MTEESTEMLNRHFRDVADGFGRYLDIALAEMAAARGEKSNFHKQD